MKLTTQTETERRLAGKGPVRPPRILLTDTDRRPYAARLALVFAELGCEVSAVYSLDGHPLSKTGALRTAIDYSAFDPLGALERAIREIEPDVVIPCDDRGVRHLHELHARSRARSSGAALADLIERSLGASASFSVVSSRYELFSLAQKQGLRVPSTKVIRGKEDFDSWQAEQPFPWVLKADETWGGRGVRIVSTRAEAERSFHELNRPFRLGRALKRMVINRDPFWLQPWWQGRTTTVTVQSYVDGRPANCAVACWQGEVLAGTAVEVVTADGLTGPASVVRVVNNPEMMRCAERIARTLNLSGFFGLDFVIENSTKDAYLIEMNPRCTPICHLRLGQGRDMIGAFWGSASGQPAPEPYAVTESDLIAYFPQAAAIRNELQESCFYDVPKGHPDLINEFLSSWPERSLLFLAASRMHQLWTAATGSRRGKPAGYGDSQA